MHYKILEHTKSSFVAIINPQAYDVSVFTGKPHQEAICAFNVNYSWLGIPIGYVVNQGVAKLLTIQNKEEIRPALCISTFSNKPSIKYIPSVPELEYTVLQAGPTLIENGKNVVLAKIKSEEFREDAVRTTAHVAVGITAMDKLVIAYRSSTSMLELAKIFEYTKCQSALKCDGGNASALWFKDQERYLKFGANNRAAAGLQLLKK